MIAHNAKPLRGPSAPWSTPAADLADDALVVAFSLASEHHTTTEPALRAELLRRLAQRTAAREGLERVKGIVDAVLGELEKDIAR
jgi:hypothetical protein